MKRYEMSSLVLPEGKYEGRTLKEVSNIDLDYILFLSQKQLTTISKIKYKAFFDRIPDITTEAQHIIEQQDVTVKFQPQQVRYPGNWRGW